MRNIVDELEKHQIILFIIDSTNYNTTVVETIKNIPKDAGVIYVTLNKTASALQHHLTKEGISPERFIIIDCISKTIKDIQDTEKIIYLDSPKALSNLSFVLTGVLQGNHKNMYILLDSLTTLLVYVDKPVAARFVLNIVNRIRNASCKSILFTVNVDGHKDFFKEISIFVDHVFKATGTVE
ncbi:MAG TPA: hypothetical protein EYP23_01815 [Thermoplasmata archaeon]|nr:hypothetical protein [Thermoplasmata archaeon]